jgi:hypothetical protein
VHGRGRVLQSMLDEVVASMAVDDTEEDDEDRETWSLAFQLRMFVPYDVQLHLPASLCASTLWT